MSSNIYTVGLRNVGSYQVSGQPYLSGATTPASAFSASIFNFPYVTKTITVTNDNEVTGGYIGFVPYLTAQAANEGYTTDSSAGNWLYIPPTSSIELNAKCKTIFVGSTTSGEIEVTIYAELTNIPTASMYSLNNVGGISS